MCVLHSTTTAAAAEACLSCSSIRVLPRPAISWCLQASAIRTAAVTVLMYKQVCWVAHPACMIQALCSMLHVVCTLTSCYPRRTAWVALCRHLQQGSCQADWLSHAYPCCGFPTL